MLLSLSTTLEPATDLGFLLSKHPDRVHRQSLPFGEAQVFYPQADNTRCTAVLQLDVDPVGLVRGRGEHDDGWLAQYVNDRPYTAGSLFAVALKRVFGTAMAGNSKDRPQLVEQPLPLEIDIPVLRCRGGAERLHACFEPLGYTVQATPLPLDPRFPEWGESPYFALALSATTLKLREALDHVYVLLPVLDGDKHYFVGADEVDKLLARAGHWLPTHPERDWITRRYFKRQPGLVQEALARLLELDPEEVESVEEQREAGEVVLEKRISLNDQRMTAVSAALVQCGATSVLDLGCGEGRLLKELVEDFRYTRLLGVDVSVPVLERAVRRLKLDRMPPLKRQRIELVQGALTYRDPRFNGFDAAVAVEVIEHMDLPRLPAFERTVFGFARPGTVIVTTPNREYNVRFEGLAEGRMRHGDHRFEWTRAEFTTWCAGVAERNGYSFALSGIGPADPELGAPTQMAVFTRGAA
jgi:3' terminal RNA ribose 2'-O-methyltransferase Hen1